MEGKSVLVGSRTLLEEHGVAVAAMEDEMRRLEDEGKTAMLVAVDGELLGLLAVADTLKDDAVAAVRELRALGLQTAMITGDNQRTARAIARQVGIDHVLAEVLPEDKLREVQRLQEETDGLVAMVGDGINDAPALTQADVGIAIGTGTDIAIEAADIALISDDLTKLPRLILHSRRTLRIIRQNIAASIAVKALFVALTFGGYASLWAAIAADMGVSLAVIFNALRLLRTSGADGR